MWVTGNIKTIDNTFKESVCVKREKYDDIVGEPIGIMDWMSDIYILVKKDTNSPYYYGKFSDE